MRFGAKGLMSTLMRVRISSDAPRCTVQFGALDPRCTMVQVHGDPNEPSLGAGAAGAPCVTLLCSNMDMDMDMDMDMVDMDMDMDMGMGMGMGM